MISASKNNNKPIGNGVPKKRLNVFKIISAPLNPTTKYINVGIIIQ
jgi:hypothetical protein